MYHFVIKDFIIVRNRIQNLFPAWCLWKLLKYVRNGSNSPHSHFNLFFFLPPISLLANSVQSNVHNLHNCAYHVGLQHSGWTTLHQKTNRYANINDDKGLPNKFKSSIPFLCFLFCLHSVLPEEAIGQNVYVVYVFNKINLL